MGYSPWGHKKLDTTKQLTLGTHLMEVQQPVSTNICKSKMHGANLPPDVASLGKQRRLDIVPEASLSSQKNLSLGDPNDRAYIRDWQNFDGERKVMKNYREGDRTFSL